MLPPEITEERQRVLQILEAHRAALEQAGLWPKIWELVNNGVDFSADSERIVQASADTLSYLDEEE